MLTMYAVSDSIGETAEQVAKATARQFKEEIIVKRVPYINTFEEANDFIESIKPEDNVMVICTIVLVEVRDFLVQRCIEKGIAITSILGPCVSTAARILKTLPQYEPGAVWNMDDDYYKKIEAMEFAMQYDDSKDNRGITHADIILIGLSRTSKTPLCMYLANKGVKAINVPLVPELEIPQELFEVDKKKIFGLTIDPLQLIDIRKHRLDKYGRITSEIQYANPERVLEELDFAEKVMRRLKCKTIDVTKRAIEDTALIILNSMGYESAK